jgi:HAD superfamily hydrolase (TIGR01509 family)
MIKALVFDFDGLMVDTESPAFQAWQELYREYNHELPLTRWAEVLGGSGSEWDPIAYLAELTGQKLDPDELRARRWQRKHDLSVDLPLLIGVQDMIDAAKRRRLRIAVASSSGRAWVRGHLDRLSVGQHFDAIVTADDVEHVKPDPALYLTAVRRLGVAPHEAIALEDSPNGVLAAKRAGLFAIAIPNALTGQLPLDHADLRLASLADMPLDDLLEIVQQRLRDRS